MQKKILVAAHKEYAMPTSDLYLPMYVGAFGKQDIGYLRDDSGDNISNLNGSFCELTAIYWAWKNLDLDCIGLAHYRRHFSGSDRIFIDGRTVKVLSEKDVERLMKRCDIILPKKRYYYIESLYSHYAHTMYVEPLDETGKIIDEFYPKYSREFARLKKRTSSHMFNMFIMKRGVFDEYCKWLFDILFKLKDRVDASQYNEFHARFIGRISELLLDVWMRTNKIRYKEVKISYTEHINFSYKLKTFLLAKFAHKKYEKSDGAQ